MDSNNLHDITKERLCASNPVTCIVGCLVSLLSISRLVLVISPYYCHFCWRESVLLFWLKLLVLDVTFIYQSPIFSQPLHSIRFPLQSLRILALLATAVLLAFLLFEPLLLPCNYSCCCYYFDSARSKCPSSAFVLLESSGCGSPFFSF